MQEGHHALLLNGDFQLGNAVAEISLLTMHTLTFGAGVPLMYPLCALALLLITVDTKVKLKYMWPIPRRHDMACTNLFLDIVKGMVYVHTAFAIWQFSFFRTFGQVKGAGPVHLCIRSLTVVAAMFEHIYVEITKVAALGRNSITFFRCMCVTRSREFTCTAALVAATSNSQHLLVACFQAAAQC